MSKNKVFFLYKNLNFCFVVICYLINKKKITNINQIYYLNYSYTRNGKNNILKQDIDVENYFIDLCYNFDLNDNEILLSDKIMILTYITILRNIIRCKKKGWFMILDNNKYDLSGISPVKLKCLKFIKNIDTILYKSNRNNSSCYLINNIGAKIGILLYIILINRAYL